LGKVVGDPQVGGSIRGIVRIARGYRERLDQVGYVLSLNRRSNFLDPAIGIETGSEKADVLGQLQQLGELKAAGVLTEEEFAAQKAKILGS